MCPSSAAQSGAALTGDRAAGAVSPCCKAFVQHAKTVRSAVTFSIALRLDRELALL